MELRGRRKEGWEEKEERGQESPGGPGGAGAAGQGAPRLLLGLLPVVGTQLGAQDAGAEGTSRSEILQG